MRSGQKKHPFSFVLILFFTVIIVTGCDYVGSIINSDVHEELDHDDLSVEEIIDEDLMPSYSSSYYWPWIHHGTIVLSSGEAIFGPDILESDQGFISEYPSGSSYRGKLVWIVDETNIRNIEWLTLAFDADYFEANEWEYSLSFDYRIEVPFIDDDGDIFEFDLNLVEQKENLKIVISKLILAEEQEGAFITKPIDYLALEIEMIVLEE